MAGEEAIEVNCPTCSSLVRPKARFCTACGSPLAGAVVPGTVVPGKEAAFDPGAPGRAPSRKGLSAPTVAMIALGVVLVLLALVVVVTHEDADSSPSDGAESVGPDTSEAGDGEVVGGLGTTDRPALALSGNGVDPVQFGMRADDALAALTDILGPSVLDEPGPDPSICPDREVSWGPFTAYFDAGSSGTPELSGWSLVGDEGGGGGAGSELRTATGIGLGSSGADIEAAFDDFDYDPGDPVGTPEFGTISPSYEVGGMFLFMTDSGPAGVVDSMGAGFNGCGE